MCRARRYSYSDVICIHHIEAVSKKKVMMMSVTPANQETLTVQLIFQQRHLLVGIFDSCNLAMQGVSKLNLKNPFFKKQNKNTLLSNLTVTTLRQRCSFMI